MFDAQGGTPKFKWRGWSNGAKIQNPKKSQDLPAKPKKIPGLKINPQKIPCRFCGHCTLFAELRSQGTPTDRFFLIPQKNPYSNQATQKNTCQIFVPKKIPESKISTPKKFFQSSPTLEIRSTPPGMLMRQNVNNDVSKQLPIGCAWHLCKRNMEALDWIEQNTLNWSYDKLCW